jgi:cyclic beta-1,2-glucan synthetase
MNFKQYQSDLQDDDKFSSNVFAIEGLENVAINLANKTKTNQEKSHKYLLKEIQSHSKDLLESYLFLTKHLTNQTLSPASEWFLDNFHIIEEQLRNIKRDLPKGFYDELPKIAGGGFDGYPRVYVIAFEYMVNTDSGMDLESFTRFVKAYQKVSPLSIGELWALAITLRISLIKRLHPLVERIIITRHMREKADVLAERILELSTKSKAKPKDLIDTLSKEIESLDKFSRPFIVQLIQRLRDQDPGISRAFDWLEEVLRSCNTSTEEIIKMEHYRQAAAQVTIGNIISSMRLISNIDWHDFFEAVSTIDPLLNMDPAGAYPRMSRSTRDSYRKHIERISKHCDFTEIEVTKQLIKLSQEMDSSLPQDGRKKHVGFYLLDDGVFELEKSLGYRSPLFEKMVRFVDADPAFAYFGLLFLLLTLFLSIILNLFKVPGNNLLLTLALIALTIIPLCDFSLGILNYFITLVRLPKRLPRMDTEKGIREQDASMVVVPCLLSNPHIIHELVNNLEVQFLGNQDEHIYYAILGDLNDADTEVTLDDKDYLALAHQLINNLNRRYQGSGHPRFYLFNRARLYNPCEKKWICWERKRGKIMEFNNLLRGSTTTTFLNQNIDYDFLKTIEYVITLDADTQLPLQNARRLIGTITHPLNLPVYGPEKNRIIAGYGILQPRISVSIVSAAKTRFSKIFAGNTGIDPYTTAVSDVYQDIFKEGSFTGKGLYVVDAFEKVIGERVPENCVLSHDLLEGSYARVGLTTDLELIDDFPSTFEVYSKRQHRWTRGDWQIALWLLPFVPNNQNKWVRNNLPHVSRWKIFDNLRRSLLAPNILLWLILSWTVLWGSPIKWTLTIVTILGFSVYAPSLDDFFRKKENKWGDHLRSCTWEMKKRFEQVFLMLVFMPSMALNQVDAIIRAVYRMAISKKSLLEWVTFSQIQGQKTKSFGFQDIFTTGPVFATFTGSALLWLGTDSFFVALPFIGSWLMAPIVSRWTKERAKPKLAPLTLNEIDKFRRYARLTWHFFENFAGESNNWLAPDNFQEEPHPVVAHRTSPTNIGLHILSILSAYDMGYIGRKRMVFLLEKTLQTLSKLELNHGHFYNWYDTRTLSPLIPRYISTVDSGNLAGHLIVLKQAALRIKEMSTSSTRIEDGFKDTLTILIQKTIEVQKLSHLPKAGSFKEIILHLENCHGMNWADTLVKLKEVQTLLEQVLEDQSSDLFTWLKLSIEQVEFYQEETDKEGEESDIPQRLVAIALISEKLYMEMDFKFLFDSERKIFAIGFNATEGKRDNSFYDLLASEARLTSFIAIAKGDVPDDHWFRLGRQLTSVVGSRALISWSATMFEYLMPLLVMRRYEGTLLDQTYDSVVQRQIEYGDQRQSPWGISEAGYHARDLNFNYQYGPFGIPGLGLKRGLRDELVISPYSTMLAAMVFPREALANLNVMEKMGVLGSYGFHESMDYTKERIHKSKKFVILKSYMAHHQGMSLISINNLINHSIMQRRFHAEPRVKAVQLLLQEKIPAITQIIKPREEETHIEGFARFSEHHHSRIYNDPSLSTPRTQILSNGNYSVMMTTAGSGFSKCEERTVTRWREDSTQDNWGQFIYIQNVTDDKTWSAGFQPTLKKTKKYDTHFSEDKIEIIREDFGVSTHTEVIISSEDNVEMRRVSLTNNTSKTIEVDLTSYMEVVLAQAKDDSAHPAFSNLFIQTEFYSGTNTLLANRRLRTKNELEVWGLHVLTIEGDAVGALQYETDRSRFLGRGRNVQNPIVMSNEIELSNTTGAVLDPIFSLRQRVRIKPYETAYLTFSTGLVYSKKEALRVSEKYHDPHIFLRQLNLGWIKAQISLRHLNITMEKAHIYQRLGGRILYLAPYLRTQSQIIMANTKNQSALWAYGISGDLPILLTRIQDEKDVDMIRELLHAHEYLRLKGLKIDLLILNEHATSYMQNLQDELMRQILISGSHHLLDKPGGIFIRRADLIPEEDLILIKSVARVRLFASKGILADQLRRRPYEAELPGQFIPTAQKRDYPRVNFVQPDLKFFNGMGGFTSDSKEYVISLKNETWTPAPWINVIANKNDFGFIISESGQGYTWSVNSRENRLTPWSNDAVSDPVSEAIYIRDEETGSFWSPTPLPIRNSEAYLIRHGQGYSQFEHSSHGLSHLMTVFVPLEDNVKIIRLKIKNLHDKPRNLSITSYVDWVLGFSRSQTSQTLVATWDENEKVILAKNSYNNEFAQRVAFITHSGEADSFTSNRKEFIGRNGTMKNPAALTRQSLSGKTGGGIDPCGSIQSSFNLKAFEEREIVILLGQGNNEAHALELAALYKDSNKVEEAFNEVKAYWDQMLGALTITTPDESMNMLVNRWLLYQTLSCRIWARSAFYQSGGAFGYRDQLQDVMAMVFSDPTITRDQIKLAASRQFPEGDVQHWWHPPTGRGVRTRFSDDLLWLPFVVNYYTQVTGDYSILDEIEPFIETPVLTEGHDETYTQPTVSEEKASIFEHCLRTIDRSLKVGVHGLPLMGSGDWNDGMSRVGNLGKGESVWMAWFLIKTLKGFIPLCEKKNENTRVATYQKHIEKLQKAIEQNAWDGEWYLRAYFDNGDKLGSHLNEECKIDAIAQSWSLISGAGNPERSKIALEAVNKYLVNREDKIIKLFTPPFDKSDADPGYIKGYVPGVRENGGQYTHAAIWTMMGYAALKDGDRATELFGLINPINRTSTLTGSQKYKVEPYVIAADIYAVDPHVGRGGWSWYTGSASWMYRSAIESILGFHLHGDHITIEPCIPSTWNQFEIKYRKGESIYLITVINGQNKKTIELDGNLIDGMNIPIIDDGKEHEILVTL